MNFKKGDKAQLINLVHNAPEAQQSYPVGTKIIIRQVIQRNGKGAVWWSKEGEKKIWLANVTDIKRL